MSLFSILVPLAVFGGVAALVWLVFDQFSGAKNRHDDRLDEIRDPQARRRKEERGKGTAAGAVTRMLEAATPALAKPLQPQKEADVNKLKAKLAHAGFRSESASSVFLGLKFMCLCVGVLFGGGSLLALSSFNQTALFRAIMFAGGMFYAPDLLIWWLARTRKEKIFLGLPDALDLMVVCVEAGQGLDQAMRRVAEEMKKAHRIIADEFGLCNLRIQMGRTRAEALHELGERNGVDDLKALASIIVQAEKFGASVGHALRVQSDSMRTRRRQIAEEKAAKTAVKLIFPLVMFIFPGIFVVLVGPAAITMVREMFPKLGGAG